MTGQRRDCRVPLLPTEDEMADPGAYLRSVVRVFPDYAGTVLWFVDGPVDYADAKLTESLAADMSAWEDAYYFGLGEEKDWKSKDLEVPHYREGLRLARALSDELGDSFDVEVFAQDSDHGEYKLRIQGRGRASNPLAVEAFKEWAAASEAEDAHFRELKASGGTFRWTAYAPLSRDDNKRGH
jgi:hypothetical protein